MTAIKTLRPFVAAFLPAFDWSFVAVGIQSGTAAVIAYYASMDLTLKILLAAVGFHLASSLAIVIFKSGKMGIKEFAQEVVAKGLAVAVVAVLGSLPQLEFKVGDQPVSGAALIGAFIIFSEAIKFGHDMEILNMKVIPSFLMNWLTNAKDGIDSGNAITLLERFSRTTKDGVEVVSKSTTVVTESQEPK